MAKARSVVDTILGEAGGKTLQERFNDMVAIASTMSNRAAMTRETLQSIVEAPNQFSAYGKELPAGVEAYRDLAQAAVDYVSANGPIHNAAYYATPAAVGNLPSALAPAGATTAHQYFTDPKNRAIGTATGYVTPNVDALSRVSAPASVTPASAPAGRLHGMEALAPHGVMGNPISNFDRSQLTPGVSGVLDAIGKTSFAGELGVNSGYRSPSVNAAKGGAKHSQHMLGNAADINVSRLTPAEKTSMLDAAIEAGAKGIGIYSSGNTIHVDARANPATWSDSYGGISPSQAPGWAQASLQGMMDAGRFNVTPRTTAPTPFSRETALAEIAAERTAPSSTPMSFVGQARPTAPSALDKLAEVASRPEAMTASFAAPAGPTTKGAIATAPNSMTAPNFAAQSLGATVAPTSVKTTSVPGSLTMGTIPGSVARVTPFDAQFQSIAPPDDIAPNTVAGLPPSLTAPALTALAPPTQLAPIAVPAPRVVRQVPLARPQMAVARPAALPSLSVADVYGGKVGSAVASDGSTVSRDRYGITSVTNKYGATTGMTTTGKQTAYGPGPSFGGLGGLGGIAGPAIGSAIGSALAGPVGGIIGGVVGRNLTKDPTGQAKTGSLGGLGGFFGGLGGLFGGGNTGSKSSGGKSAGSGSGKSASAGRSAGSSGFGGNRAGSARAL